MDQEFIEILEFFLAEVSLKKMAKIVDVKWYRKSNYDNRIIFGILCKMSLLLKSKYVPSVTFDGDSSNGKKLVLIEQILKSLWEVSDFFVKIYS